MSRRISAAAALASACAIVGLVVPAHAVGTTAAPVRVLAPEPPVLCTPEQEDLGATDDKAKRDCHAKRALSVGLRAQFYEDRAIEIRDPASSEDARDLQDIREAVTTAQQAAEKAQTAEDASLAASDAQAAAEAARLAADGLTRMTKASATEDKLFNAADAAQDAAYNADGAGGRDVALNKAADVAEKATHDGITWS
ncbi:hypothetical protein ACFPM3_06725 [Streptomyces coeruleoprunus]|uniref:Uncharacterized protein n=1 Tax=Streptomyces coeruleoprunus TaxID=285563 RepID=A0ABV9XD07_9ACTN